jgi:hypothetical protein
MSGAREAVATSVAALGFWASWFACTALQLPMWWYLPLEHRWVWSATPPGLAMCLYGQLVMSLAVAAIAGGLAWAVAGRLPLKRAHVWISTGWCAVLLCFVIGYFAFALWGRTIG